MSKKEIVLKCFHEWLRNSEIICKNLELKYCGDECGFGLFAIDNIRLSETIIQVRCFYDFNFFRFLKNLL